MDAATSTLKKSALLLTIALLLAAPFLAQAQTAFSFQKLDGSIQVIVDTSSTPTINLTSVGNPTLGQAIYVGTITGGRNNAYVGLIFTVTGFTNASNNTPTGFVCTGSTDTTLTLTNPGAIAETHAGTAISSGAGK